MMKYTVVQKLNSCYRSSINGFTLIELMVVVVIIAILAAIAIPSYRAFVIKNAENDAQAAMQNQAVKLKRWRAKALNYKGYKIDTSNNYIYIPEGSTSANYRYKITLVDGNNTSKALTDTSVTGQSWVMLAEPNSSSIFSTANVYLMKNNGNRCYVDHTRTLTLASDCTGSGVMTW